jgi:hypothetical protein
LPWCVTRAKARRRATAASPGCGMPAGSVCRQSRTNVTRCSDQLVQHGRVVPGCFGVVTAANGSRHICHAGDSVRATMNPPGRPQLRSPSTSSTEQAYRYPRRA